MPEPSNPPDSPKGLSSRAAAYRLGAVGPNELPQGKPRNLLHLIRDVMRDPMFLLLVACGVLYLILGEIRDALMLLAFVLLVIVITVYQEYKTERALSALKELTSPRAMVIRDGVRMLIPSRELVPGDLVVIAEGDRVPADGVLIEGQGLSVDESLLTGEAVPVMRAPETQSAQISSGTLVVQGRGLMRVERTGRETAIGTIGHSLVTLEHPVTRLETETGRVVRILAIIGGGISVLVAAGYALKGAGWLQGALAGLTLAMSILPEEFPVVLVVFLALGAWRLAKHNVLTRRMNAIETLGAASVLCVDKTGTLTMNRMRLAALHDGELLFEFNSASIAPDIRFSNILRHGALASPPESFDPMEQALFTEAGDQTEHVLLREYPLSHNLMAITRILRTDEGEIIGACKGAPEAIIELCNPAAARRKALEQAASQLAARGWRVLGVASVREPRPERLPENLRHFAFEFLGFMAFEDPLRAGVPDAVHECHRAGIRVMLITGDHARTASSIARQAGIPEPDNTLSGADIERMDNATLLARLRNTQVFCRMVPQQKLRLVQALQSLGHVVAMTGDGVNDAPALKAADIGIAMGLRGTDVAREAADIVLADDDFLSIVRGVRMGRRIHGNLARAVTYIIAVHIPIVGLATLPLAAGWPLLLMPIHVMLVEMVIDPTCSIVLEAEPEDPGIMQRPPRSLREPLFSLARVRWGLLQGLFGLLAVIGACSIGVVAGEDAETLRSIAIVALLLMNLVLIQMNRTPVARAHSGRNPAVWVVTAAAAMVLLAVLLVPWLRDVFHLGALNAMQFGYAAGVAILAALMVSVLRSRALRP